MENRLIAVLLTCHNRRDKTVKCLTNLFQCNIPKGYTLDVFLVDDGSTDHTGDAIRKKFPEVNVIQGDGTLYWNGGMRLAWKTAKETKSYDFYIWLNDDTFLFENSIVKIFNDYNHLKNKGSISIITGACKSPYKDRCTFGGHENQGLLEPNGFPQKCKFINGNFTLIPNEVFKNVGMLSETYTHAYGDFDYGLRAQYMGYSCWVSSEYLATCENDKREAVFSSFRERAKWVFDDTHSFFSDLLHYKKTHFGMVEMGVTFIKVCLKIISPNSHKRLKELFKGKR